MPVTETDKMVIAWLCGCWGGALKGLVSMTMTVMNGTARMSLSYLLLLLKH